MSNDRGAYPGHLAHEYINIGGTFESPTWVRVARVEDVDLPDERSSGDFKLKGSDFVKTVVGPRTTSIGFKYRKKLSSDPVYDELLAAYEDAASCVDYAATDLAIATVGAKGFRGPYKVTKFSESRPYENVVEVDVELKLADAEREDLPDNAGEYIPWEREAIVTT